jgi:type IV pilus biogenesis protein CpaD/CtpE
MQLRMPVALAIVAAASCAGCQSAQDKDVAAHREPVYRTGSNIPVRDPEARSSVLTVRPDDAMARTNMPSPKPGPPIP